MELSWLLYAYLAISTIWFMPVLWKVTESKARDAVLKFLWDHMSIILIGAAPVYTIVLLVILLTHG